MKEKRKLNSKQRKFVAEVALHGNATKAAKEAGYSEDTARQIAAENLRKPHIQQAIEQKLESYEKKTGITKERVLHELAKIGFFDISTVVSWETTESGETKVWIKSSKDIPPESLAAIAEITKVVKYMGEVKIEETKIKFHDKKAPLIAIGEHLGMFIKRVGNPDGNPLTFIDLVKLAQKSGDGTVTEPSQPK